MADTLPVIELSVGSKLMTWWLMVLAAKVQLVDTMRFAYRMCPSPGVNMKHGQFMPREGHMRSYARQILGRIIFCAQGLDLKST